MDGLLMDILAWSLIAVFVVLTFKFLMTAGKGLIYAILMFVVFCVLYRFFPEYVAPALDFIAASREEMAPN